MFQIHKDYPWFYFEYKPKPKDCFCFTVLAHLEEVRLGIYFYLSPFRLTIQLGLVSLGIEWMDMSDEELKKLLEGKG